MDHGTLLGLVVARASFQGPCEGGQQDAFFGHGEEKHQVWRVHAQYLWEAQSDAELWAWMGSVFISNCPERSRSLHVILHAWLVVAAGRCRTGDYALV